MPFWSSVMETTLLWGRSTSRLWKGLSVKREDTTRGQMIANIISNSAMAIDAFLMVRKLKKNYGGIFQFFKKKKS